MKHLSIFLAAGAALAFGAVAAEAQTTAKVSAEIVQRNASGQATQVRIDGRIYDVCMSDTQDSCINPRAAGLNFGNHELAYWPGRPASERPLPRQASR